MSVFEVIYTVLKELFTNLPGVDDEEKKEKVKNSLNKLTSEYTHLNTQNIIDYSALETRFAYLYKYVTSHANLVFFALQRLSSDRINLNCSSITCCSLGVGPGTEILGMVKFLKHKKIERDLTFYMLDRENHWFTTIDEVIKGINYVNSITPVYISADFQASNQINNANYLNSDIFFMVYSLSEISNNRCILKFIFQTVQQSKKGALFIYIDNFVEKQNLWVVKFFTFLRLVQVYSCSGNYCLGSEEQKTSLGEFLFTSDSPKITAYTVIYVWEKV